MTDKIDSLLRFQRNQKYVFFDFEIAIKSGSIDNKPCS